MLSFFDFWSWIIILACSGIDVLIFFIIYLSDCLDSDSCVLISSVWSSNCVLSLSKDDVLKDDWMCLESKFSTFWWLWLMHKPWPLGTDLQYIVYNINIYIYIYQSVQFRGGNGNVALVPWSCSSKCIAEQEDRPGATVPQAFQVRSLIHAKIKPYLQIPQY